MATKPISKKRRAQLKRAARSATELVFTTFNQLMKKCKTKRERTFVATELMTSMTKMGDL